MGIMIYSRSFWEMQELCHQPSYSIPQRANVIFLGPITLHPKP